MKKTNTAHFAALTLANLSIFSTARASAPSFNRDIRPILSENCFLCHGQDPEHRGGELRLDIREKAIAPRDDGPAIVPGKPEESAMIIRILSKDPDEKMPPDKAHLTPLKPAQIETLKKWIAAGTVYQPHWSFAPPVKATPPSGSPNPVDAFVRSRLAEVGLKPSPAAPIETQIRRLHLDLTGLPPAPAEIDSYLADTSPDRWEKRIKLLMESPHFAERMAMPWLDAARYSDTHGFSIDDHRDMWAWRDWVIHAFQTNQPYDQFVREQVAGDLIPNATPDQIAATGFLRNSMNTHEGGTIEEEYRIAQVIDKVDAVATTMLGLTMKCAQCHDHKFDPISHKDYFSFFAFFNSSTEPGKGATNSSTKPVMEYASPLGDGGMEGIRTRIAELEFLKLHPSREIVAARESWEARMKSAPPSPAAFPWDQFTPANTKWIWAGNPLPEQTVSLTKEFTVSGKVQEAWLFNTCDDSSTVTINGKPAGEVSLWSAPAVKDVTTLLKEGANLIEASAANAGGAGGFVGVLAVRTEAGWNVFPTDATWQAKAPGAVSPTPATILADFGAAPWGDVTASLKSADAGGTLTNLLAIPAATRSNEQWVAINAAFLKSGNEHALWMENMIKTLDVEIEVIHKDLKRGKTTVMVMDHKPGIRKTQILERGAYDQPKGDEIFPDTPSALPKLNTNGTPTRLELANWITDPINPLTARVQVNRLWQMVFGRGIVETAGDFGNQGSWPSHPELLDWLAVNLVENGWDLRHVLEIILTSETYRQSSVTSPEQLEKDPRNELLSRSPRTRLPAELIRDQALAVSGLLNAKLGGPGVHPPQPDLWSEISHFGYIPPFTSQIFLPSRGESSHRRSIYTFWKRTSPPPSMVLFDAPTRETCSVVRGSTNTPLQALVILNEPQYVQAGIELGRRMIAEGGQDPAARTTYGFRLATGRLPTAEEKSLLAAALERSRKRYESDASAAQLLVDEANPELAAYATIGSILLNLDELINRP